jgi:hypothetical protein
MVTMEGYHTNHRARNQTKSKTPFPSILPLRQTVTKERSFCN